MVVFANSVLFISVLLWRDSFIIFSFGYIHIRSLDTPAIRSSIHTPTHTSEGCLKNPRKFAQTCAILRDLDWVLEFYNIWRIWQCDCFHARTHVQSEHVPCTLKERNKLPASQHMKRKAYKMLESSCSKTFWGRLIQSSTSSSLQKEKSQAAASQLQGALPCWCIRGLSYSRGSSTQYIDTKPIDTSSAWLHYASVCETDLLILEDTTAAGLLLISRGREYSLYLFSLLGAGFLSSNWPILHMHEVKQKSTKNILQKHHSGSPCKASPSLLPCYRFCCFSDNLRTLTFLI